MSICLRFRLLRVLVLLALPVLPGVPSPAPGQQPGLPSHPTSTPYSGDLSIFESPGREDRLQIERVMDLLGVKKGVTVADLGAGSGWFTVRAARRVGPGGSVLAEDINPAAVTYIRDRAKRENLGNVQAIEGTPDDPKLPAGSTDVVLLLKVYHEIAHPQVLLANLKQALRPGAHIGIIDRNGSGDDHGLNEGVVVREMAAAGFTRIGRYNFTKADGQDYFLLFKEK